MPINYKDYPASWLTDIRPRILARDKHRCKFCNIPNHLVIKRLKGDAYRTPGAQEWDMINSRVKYSHTNLTESLRYHGFTKVARST